MGLFETGIRPKIDEYLENKAKERRDYGEYWSASSAGYCMRKNIMERMQIPYTLEDPRKQRVFEAGHIFHEWVQRITKEAGLSISQELELQDETLKIRGHIDDLVEVNGTTVLYDYKTQNSRAFSYQKDKPMNYYHKMQLGTYMYMLRDMPDLSEGRILKISKDDLRMAEQRLLWTPELEKEVVNYWQTLNNYWESQTLPQCECARLEGGFMASEKYNPFFYRGQPCSEEWFQMHKNIT